MQAQRDPLPPRAAAAAPRGALTERLALVLQRARELQQVNLLARLTAETVRARVGQTQVVLAAERCLRQG